MCDAANAKKAKATSNQFHLAVMVDEGVSRDVMLRASRCWKSFPHASFSLLKLFSSVRMPNPSSLFTVVSCILIMMAVHSCNSEK